MADLSTNYLGLKLKNPIIIGSCGLTDSVKSIIELEKSGAAAVVLKSIFEEEITLEYDKILKQADSLGYHEEELDYFDYKIRERNISNYLELIREAKKNVEIPVIASVNCRSSHEWAYFAKNCQEAGADAIEMNIFLSPANLNRSCEQNEQLYFEMIKNVLDKVNIPVSVKISPYFSNLASMIKKLSKTGISGIVLFNRFFSPDFDIDKLELVPSHVLSSPKDIALSLRWIALMSQRTECDLAASTGVHDGKAVVKQLLAGAKAVEVVSTIYENGNEHIAGILDFLNDWMEAKNFGKISDFNGKMSQAESDDPAVYERVQFMKFFSKKF